MDGIMKGWDCSLDVWQRLVRTWMPAPVIMPMRKLGTTDATAIMRLSTQATQTKRQRVKYTKCSSPGCSSTMKYTMHVDTVAIKNRKGMDDIEFPTTKAATP